MVLPLAQTPQAPGIAQQTDASFAFAVCEISRGAAVRLTSVSQGITRLIGHSAEDLLRQGSLFANADLAGQAALTNAIAESQHAGHGCVVCRMAHMDGHLVWTRINFSITRRDADGVTAACALSEGPDGVTLQAELQQTQERLSALVNNAPGVLTQSEWTQDGRWRRVYFSSNVERLTGYTAAQVMEPGVWDSLLDAESLKARSAATDDALRTGEGAYKFRVRHARAHWVWVQNKMRATPAPDGGWLFTATLLDITALRAASEARDAAEARLAVLVNSAPGVLFQSEESPDGHWQRSYISGNVLRVLGYSVEQIKADGAWTALTDADGRKAHAAAIAEARRTGFAVYECWIRHAGGHQVRTRSTFGAERFADGTWRFTGYMQDVTALHEATQARNAAEVRLAALVRDAPNTLFEATITPGGEWVSSYQSNNVPQLLGFTHAQIMVRGGWETLHDAEGLAARQRAVDHALRTGEATYDAWLTHADGHRIRARTSWRAVPGENGEQRFIGTTHDITDLHEANLARAAAEARLAALVQDSPGLLFQDVLRSDGAWERLYISPNVQSLTGHSQQSSTGVLPLAMRSIDADGQAAWQAAIQRARATGEAVCEFRALHADGRGMWLRANLKARLNDGGDVLLTGYMVDISNERNLTDALNTTRRQLEEIVASSPGWLYRVTMLPDGAWRLDYVSENIERATGYTVAEVSEPGWLLSVLDPTSQPNVTRAAQQLLRRERTAWEYRIRTKAGNWIWISDTLNPNAHFSADGGLQAVGFATDITPFKEQAAQLQQAARLAVLGEMASGMAHELRQPLSTISFAAQNAELALGRNDPDNVQKRLARIVEQTERASNIIEHLRQFARGPESAAQSQPVALDVVVDGALTLVGEPLRLDGIKVELDLGEPPPVALAQTIPLEQVMVNLLLNARDALVAHRPAHRRIRIIAHAASRPGFVQLWVSDNGGGIANAILPQIFQPFVTTKLADKGTGLGLSICHGIITRLGGDITVRNDADGAVCTITLPAAPVLSA